MKTCPPAANRPPYRVMIVDDHPILRVALAGLVNAQSDLKVCADAGNPAQAMSSLPRPRPDLLVTDFRMPGRGGIEFIKDVWAFDPKIKILVLSMHDEENYAERALRAGARGFIMKNAGSDAILSAMRQVLAGGVFLSAKISSRVFNRDTGSVSRNGNSPVGQLSDRELEVFRLSGEGCDAHAIAQQLCLSRKTVDVHSANIRKKLGFASSTALIRHAVQWVEKEYAVNG